MNNDNLICWDYDISFIGSFDGTLFLKNLTDVAPDSLEYFLKKYKEMLSFSVALNLLSFKSVNDNEVLYSECFHLHIPENVFSQENEEIRNELIKERIDAYLEIINADEKFMSILVKKNLKQCDLNEQLRRSSGHLVSQLMMIVNLRKIIKEKDLVNLMNKNKGNKND